MSKELIIVISLFYLWSFWLAFKLLVSPKGRLEKGIGAFLLLIPVVGPIVYLFSFEQPPLNRYKHRKNNIGNISSYDNYFERDARHTKERIDKLNEKNPKEEKHK